MKTSLTLQTLNVNKLQIEKNYNDFFKKLFIEIHFKIDYFFIISFIKRKINNTT